MIRWLKRRSMKVRMTLVVVATFLVFAGVGTLTASHQQSSAVKGESTVRSASPDNTKLSGKKELSPARTEIETTEEDVPFSTSTVDDGALPKDTTVVRVEGAKGKKVTKTEVKYRNGVEISRQLISETVTVPPVNKVVAVGTRVVAKSQTAQTSSDDPCNQSDDNTVAGAQATADACTAGTGSGGTGGVTN